MRKNKAHLEFTLFPFVSILLAVIGVMVFLTMLQTVIVKSSEENPQEHEDEKIIARSFSRIPKLRVNTLTFYKGGCDLKLSNGNVQRFKSPLPSFKILMEIRMKMIAKNLQNNPESGASQEHLVYVVKSGGENVYFDFVRFLRIQMFRAVSEQRDYMSFLVYPKGELEINVINPGLSVGLVLLNPGEQFKY